MDSKHSHRAWINTPINDNGLGKLNFPLAADITKTVARDYGVLIEEEGIALRGLFIIDPEGELKYQVVNHNDVGRSVEETFVSSSSSIRRSVPNELETRRQTLGCEIS